MDKLVEYRKLFYVAAFVVGFAIALSLIPLVGHHGGGDYWCISSPINEMLIKIQTSQAGINTKTDAICIYAGESLPADTLINRVSNVQTVTFSCGEGAAVCSGNSPGISVSSQALTANSDVIFRAIVSCTKNTDTTGDYECILTIVSA